MSSVNKKGGDKFGFLDIYLYICTNVYGRVAELVDATDLKSVEM